MKKNIKLSAAFFTLLFLLTGAVTAEEPKMASVDINALISEYYRLPIEEKKLIANAERVKKEDQVVMDQLKTMGAELVKLKEAIDDSATAKEKRAQLAKEYEAKLKKAQNMRKAGIATNTRRGRAFEVEKLALLTSMRSDIVKIVTKYAESEGYELVFDKAGITSNLMPFVVYSKGSTDITESVLKILNVAAPATK